MLPFPYKWYNPFPKIRYTERPDTAAAQLMEGSVLILCDTSPQVMILPTSIFDFMQETNDYYFTPLTGTYIRVVRYIVFVLSLFLVPTWYLLISNAEMIPAWLQFIIPQEAGRIPIIAQLLLTYTKVGRNIFAVGGSAEAAFFSGINVKLYKFGTFILASITATFGGLVLMSRLNSVAVTNGQNYEFDAVISSIIGGISLAGGKGNVIGTMFGCVFLITLFNGFTMIGIDPFVQDVLKGIVLITAVTLDVMNTNRKKKN